MPNRWNTFQSDMKSLKLPVKVVSQLYKKFNGDSDLAKQSLGSKSKAKITIRMKAAPKIKIQVKRKPTLEELQDREEEDFKVEFSNIKTEVPLEFKPKYLSLREVLRIIINNYNPSKHYLINVVSSKQNAYYTLSDRNATQLYSLLFDDGIDHIFSPSDADFDLILEVASSLIVTQLGDKRKRKVAESGFFPFWNTSDIDLKKYQIFREDDEWKKIHEDNCFVYALKQSCQFTVEEIAEIKLFIQTRDLSVRKITEICKKFDFSVHLKRRRKNGKLDIDKINGVKSRHIPIGVLHNHYFLNENRSFERIENLELLGKFVPIGVKDIIEMTSEYYKNENKHIESLTIKPYEKDSGKPYNCRPFKMPQKESKRTHIWVADFESYQDSLESSESMKCSLKPLLLVAKRSMYMNELGEVSHVSDALNVYQKLDKDGLKMFFNEITSRIEEYGGRKSRGKEIEKAIVYFHNLKYDFIQMLQLMDNEVYIESILPHGGSLLSAKINYGDVEIELRCSYRLTTMSIKDLAKSFLGKDQQKEMCPYELYNEKTKDVDSVPISVLREFYQGKELRKFLDIAKEFIHDGRFYLHSYNEFYCIRDVEILDEALWKFQLMITEEFHMPVNAMEFLTFPSLADYYVSLNGAYDGVYELSGMPQLFCSQAVVGGRCMTNSNKAWKVQEEIVDEDVNSLYPAAMSQIEFPVGIPKEIGEDYNLSSVPYYIVEIEVLDISKKRGFPLLSKKNKSGVRIFNNEIRGKIIIDKISLEDAVKFQGLKYRLIRGYVWSETNRRIQAIIKHIYNKRIELKKSNDQRELIYKLMMNSSYGKNLLKPYEKKSGIYNKRDFSTKVINAYQNINKITTLPHDRYLIEEYSQTLEQFNRVHIGCQILSQSKRIMNKVMCLAEDIGIKIYYQDTDSMHLPLKDRTRLEIAYREEYNDTLYDKYELGKLSSDFKVEDQNGKVFKDGIGTEGYYLGKKQYAVCVQNNKGQVGYHMRQKGIPSSFMKYGDYSDMIEGKTIVKKLIDPENPKSVTGIRLTNLSSNILRSFHRTIKCNQEKISENI